MKDYYVRKPRGIQGRFLYWYKHNIYSIQQSRDFGVGSTDMTVKWYQNVDGVDGAVFKDPRRADSKFWGEGKWKNFILPLLPLERRTFVEIGCNAGLFLKLATDAGFKDVIGIEADEDRVDQAAQYLRTHKSTYKIIYQKVDNNFDWDQLPLTDVTLLSNVHYYFPINTFMKLVDHLRSRSLYCIVVSAKARRRSGRTRHYLEAVRGYFDDWEEIKVVGDWQGIKSKDVLKAEGDPAPRQQMYGVIFKGVLESVNVEAECAKWEKKWVQGTIELDEYGKILSSRRMAPLFQKAIYRRTF